MLILPPCQLGGVWECRPFALLGIVTGLVAIVLMRSVYLVASAADKTLPLPAWLRPVLAGLARGLLALRLPNVLEGAGYEATDAALLGRCSPWLLIAPAVLRTVVTAR